MIYVFYIIYFIFIDFRISPSYKFFSLNYDATLHT